MKRLALAAVMALASGVVLATPSAAQGEQQRQLAEVRAATARFHQVANAIDAGYVSMGHCEASPEGAMGIHFAKAPDGPPVLDIHEPTVLLYEPTANGLRLVGVEYMVVDADQRLDTDDDRPSLFGVPFDGPMVGHAPGMPVHYDLHVWVWRHNPNGMFAQFNPKVRC